MEIFWTILLVVACANANSIHRYGWKPGMESIFRFESQSLHGIPEIKQSQWTGLRIVANIRVQAMQDYTLRVKIEDAQIVTLNGDVDLNEDNRLAVNGGQESGALHLDFPPEFKQHLETPVLVHLKRGLVEQFFVSRDEPISVTNLKRSVLSQLQLNISGSQQVVEHQGSHHKVLEESVLGNCYTTYNVIPVTPARAMGLERSWYEEESMANLQHSNEGKKACENKQYYEIIKTRDLDHCDYRPVFQHVSGAEFSGDVSKARVGNLFTHSSSSTTYVCGQLSSFNIRKIVVDEKIVANPVGFNTEQKERTQVRIMLELIKKVAITSQIQAPTASRKETSLVYMYPEQREMESKMSADVIQKTQEILGTRPIFPQPTLNECPKQLVPIGIPRSQIIPQVVSEMKTIAKTVFESPESCTQEQDISGRLLTTSKLMQEFNLQDFEQVWTQTLAVVAEPIKRSAKYLIIDTAAMVGTNPAVMFVLKKLDAGDMDFIKATASIQSAMKSIQTPTKELVKEIIMMVKQWKNGSSTEKKNLLTPALLQLSNLIYHAYVNPSTMAGNFPVRIYGIFGTEHSPVVMEYISFLKQWLEQSEQDPRRAMKPVIVTAIGKLGLLDAAKPLLEIAQGVNGEEPMYRSLAVHSLKRTAVRYPRQMRAVLLAIINNPLEHADVRIAAISVLPWAQPSYVELQQLAIRSWYDRSNQVSSYAHSTLASLIHTEVPELEAVAAKARGVIHMFKPMHYGLQFAKNFQESKYVKYLVSSVNTELQFAQTKDNIGPSKVSLANHMIMKVLGEGIRIKLDSWTVYSQGLDMIIEKTLQMSQLFKGVLATSPMVDKELKKIAEQIQLTPRHLPDFKSFIQSYNLGYEYAVQLTFDQILKLIANLGQSNIKDEFARGVSGEFVTAANLIFAEFKGPNELGLPIVARKDLVSIVAAKAYAKTEATKYGIRARLVPVLNMKHQSDSGIVAPFKLCSECRVNGYSGNGVSISFHTSLPIEAAMNVSRGELEIELSAPQQSFANGRNHELIHGLVTPYTVRAPWASVVPFNKAQDVREILSGSSTKKLSKSFSGLVSGEFTYESDNEFVDFFSYWQKIRQHSPLSLAMTLPFVSSVRKSSVRLEIDPPRSEFKKALLNVKLFTQQPSELMNLISKPVEPQILQEIKSIHALDTAHSLLSQSPTTIVKVDAAIKENYATKSVEAYTVVGYKQAVNQSVKSAAAFAGRLKQASTLFTILYEGNLKRPIVNARWNKEAILNQPLELTYNGKVVYGPENDQQKQEKIEINANIHKTESQTNSVKESPEFKRCAEEEQAGRKLSPICVKVRNQAGSLDRAQITIALPHSIYQSRALSTVEEVIKSAFFANYKQMQSTTQMPIDQVKLDLAFSRAGNVAHIVVEHRHDAYNLTNIRVPLTAQGVMPFNVRCPFNPIGDAIEEKLSDGNAPATCRVEPSVIRSFDNRTYNYKINKCEHVLLTDGQSILPVGVLTRTISGEQKMVKVLSGQAKVEVIPESGSLKLKLNGQRQTINQGKLFVVKDTQTGESIAEIKYYQDGVYQIYAPLQMMHVITDGKRVEIVAPQLLKNRALGLCGNMNGEEANDLTTPKRCIMQPKLAAVSYMLNKNGNEPMFAQCPKVAQPHLAAYQREDKICTKEEIVKTQILAIFEKAQVRNLKFEEQVSNVRGYTTFVGACDGGENPENDAGMTKYGDRNCLNRCNQDSSCTGYTLPVWGANWCATFKSVGATGNYDPEYQCFMKSHFKAVCPTRCKTCKNGGSKDGGLLVNSHGVCERFCSKKGYCGDGKAYKTGDDCRGCDFSDVCPEKCSTCGRGSSRDGGMPLNSKNVCEYFCSKQGYCGNGEAYKDGGVACTSHACGLFEKEHEGTCDYHLQYAYKFGRHMASSNIQYKDMKKITGVEPNDASYEDFQRLFKCSNIHPKDCNQKGLDFPHKCSYPPCNTCIVKESVCKTVGPSGQPRNAYCMFPFTHENVTYTECAYNKIDGFWCPTKNNVNVKSNTGWGVCDFKCPLTDPNVRKLGQSILCKDMGFFEIASETKCMQAASKLGLLYGTSFNDPGDDPGCIFDKNWNIVLYNLSPNPWRTTMKPYNAAICKVPSVRQPLPATLCSSDGLNDINSAVNCEAAAKQLYPNGYSFNSNNRYNGYEDIPGCYSSIARDQSTVLIHFNSNPNPRRNELSDKLTSICEDNNDIDSECPDNRKLPVLREGFGLGTDHVDQFYCAFSWNKLGNEDPMSSCNGHKTAWMANANWNGTVPVGSVIVKAGCALYGYSDYDYKGNKVKYSGPGTYPNACSTTNGKDNCSKFGLSQSSSQNAAGFRSVKCRCRQDPIVCQPYDKWVLIAQYNNKLNYTAQFKYTKEVGTTWSSEAMDSFAISASIQASMSASFFSMIETSLSVSGTTGYNWGTVSTQAKSVKETFEITEPVHAYTNLMISGVEANCGSNNIKTEMFKTEAYDSQGNMMSKRYYHNIPKSEDISDFK